MNAIKGLVIGMSLLIVTLTTVIGYGLYQKATNPDFTFFAKDKPPAQVSDIPQPIATPYSAPSSTLATSPAKQVVFGERLVAGARIVSSQVDGGRLILTISNTGENADRVVILDLASGATLGTVRLAQ